jgi:hypothetical protein
MVSLDKELFKIVLLRPFNICIYAILLKKRVILKLDFEKAFNKVEHHVILKMISQ